MLRISYSVSFFVSPFCAFRINRCSVLPLLLICIFSRFDDDCLRAPKHTATCICPLFGWIQYYENSSCFHFCTDIPFVSVLFFVRLFSAIQSDWQMWLKFSFLTHWRMYKLLCIYAIVVVWLAYNRRPSDEQRAMGRHKEAICGAHWVEANPKSFDTEKSLAVLSIYSSRHHLRQPSSLQQHNLSVMLSAVEWWIKSNTKLSPEVKKKLRTMALGLLTDK